MLIGLDLHLWCQTCWDSLKTLICLNYFFPSEGLSEAFIGRKTFFFHSASLFQIRKHISNAMCHAMYDCAWMKCLSIKTHFFNSFSSFIVLTNAKCKCHMQIPWLVLPMRYATIVPQYAIYRLLITDLDVNFLWMQTKCDANLDFLFPMPMLLDEDANAIFYLWCKCPMQGWKCKVYSWCTHSNHDAKVSSQR